jgi:hypothetical protein
MHAEYISLAALLKRSQLYQHMPQPIRGVLRRSVWLSLFLTLAYLAFALGVPDRRLVQGIPVDGFFFITTDFVIWSNRLLDLLVWIEQFLLAVTGIGLILIGGVVILSSGMTAPTSERVQWLGVTAAVPALVSSASVGMVGMVLVAVTLLTFGLWVIIITAGLFIGVPLGIRLGFGLWRR